MEKLLVIGGSGLLGSNVAKIATPYFEVYSSYYKNPVHIKEVEFFQLDLTKKTQLEKIKEIKPDFIINCSALTNVDYCEKYPKEAYKQNVESCINLAKISKNLGSFFLHISTDSVFDGEKGNYNEMDEPNPVNIYGKTKLMAEEAINNIYPESCIIRTNIYGWNIREKFSLAEWVIDTLKKNESLNGFCDVYFAPIFVNDLSKILFKLRDINHNGIIHIGSDDCISKLDFAITIADIFNLDKNLIDSVSIEELKFDACRPKKTCLDVSKAKSLFNDSIISTWDGILHMKEKLDNGYVEELKYG